MVGAIFSVVGMGGIVLGILVWQEGGEAVGALLVVGAVAMALLVWWLVRRKREGKPALIDPDLFASKIFRLGISGQMLQQIALGGDDDRPADLPADGARVQRDAGRPVDRAALAEHVRAWRCSPGSEAGATAPEQHHPAGFLLLTVGVAVLLPIVPRADSGW